MSKRLPVGLIVGLVRNYIMAALPASLLIVGLLTCLAIAGPDRPDNSPRPRAVFSELTHDAGLVEAGAEIAGAFKLKNKGSAPLIIEQVKPSCGCTLADYTSIIPPGKKGTVTLKTTSPILRPDLVTTAWVYTNDPDHRQVLLTLKGTVKVIVELQPSPSMEIRAQKGHVAESKLTLVNRHASPLEIVDVETTNPDFFTGLRALEPGQRYELTVGLKKNYADGVFVTQVTVVTDNKRLPRIPIAVVATVAPRTRVSPSRIAFGLIDSIAPASPPFNVFAFKQGITIVSDLNNFRITRAVSNLSFVQVEVYAPKREAQPHHVIVSLLKESLPRGPFSGTITLNTNDPELGEVIVPVTGEVR